MSGTAVSPSWRPELQEPHVALRSFEELGFVSLDDPAERHRRGVELSCLLIEEATAVEFPAQDESIKVDEEERSSRVFPMRYLGPNFLRLPGLAEHGDIVAMQAAYSNMPSIWHEEFPGQVDGVRTLPNTDRQAYGFVTNPSRGESGDPHQDTYLTAAGYMAPGAALVVSHCLNARNITDIQAQPSTLVLPRALSFAFFLGTHHPHVGINLGITTDQTAEQQQEHWRSLDQTFNIAEIIHNIDTGKKVPDPRELEAWPELRGDRVVISLNFETDEWDTTPEIAAFFDGSTSGLV